MTKKLPAPKRYVDHELHCVEIAPENVDTDALYAFNWNPITQPVMDSAGGYTRWLTGCRRLLNRCLNCEITSVPEVSPKGRVHFHGLLSIDNVINFYLFDLQKLMGFGSLKIATIADSEVWRIYMYKQEALMKPFCEDVHAIVYEYTTTRQLGPQYIDGIIE